MADLRSQLYVYYGVLVSCFYLLFPWTFARCFPFPMPHRTELHSVKSFRRAGNPKKRRIERKIKIRKLRSPLRVLSIICINNQPINPQPNLLRYTLPPIPSFLLYNIEKTAKKAKCKSEERSKCTNERYQGEKEVTECRHTISPHKTHTLSFIGDRNKFSR